MKAITEILDQVVESFTGKRGKVEQNILVLVDREPAGRLRNTFDYVMSEDEIKKHTGKLTGKKCELAVTDIQPAFGGRLRMRGQILSLPLWSVMETPEIHILSRIDWQFFGTLTFKSERLPERVRLALYFAMLRCVAAEFRVYFPRLLWCLRQETGEQFGRRHFHYLLAGLPASGVSKTTCFYQMSTWEKVGGGMARVSEFDPRLNGEGYILKCLGYADAGDYYESAKFGGHCQLMLSHSILKVVRANVAWRDRRLAH